MTYFKPVDPDFDAKLEAFYAEAERRKEAQEEQERSYWAAKLEASKGLTKE